MLNSVEEKIKIQSLKVEEFENFFVRFKETRSLNIPVNAEILWEKAVQLSKSFEIEYFYESHKWIEKKNKHKCSNRFLSEERSENEITLEQWKVDLVYLVNGYEISTIVTKLYFFHKLLRDRVKLEPCHGCKKVEWHTVLLCYNVDVSKTFCHWSWAEQTNLAVLRMWRSSLLTLA